MTTRWGAALAAAVLCSSLAACGGGAPPPAPPGVPQNPPMKDPSLAAFDEEPAATPAEPGAPPASTPAPAQVTVKIEARSGSKLSGEAVVSENAKGGVSVVLTVENAGAPGPHGAHFHEKGDCSAPDGASAGGHFNPDKHDHALPAKETRHLGDMGNIEVGKDGKGRLEIEIPGANLKSGDPKSLRGRAIIVHEKKDDGGQPVGNAGGRIGCGVVPS